MNLRELKKILSNVLIYNEGVVTPSNTYMLYEYKVYMSKDGGVRFIYASIDGDSYGNPRYVLLYIKDDINLYTNELYFKKITSYDIYDDINIILNEFIKNNR